MNQEPQKHFPKVSDCCHWPVAVVGSAEGTYYHKCTNPECERPSCDAVSDEKLLTNKDNQPAQECEVRCRCHCPIPQCEKWHDWMHTITSCECCTQPSKKDHGEDWKDKLENILRRTHSIKYAGATNDFLGNVEDLLHATDQKARRECADIVESYFKGKETFSAHTFKAEEGVIKKILNQK